MITIPDPADKMPDNYKPLSDAELDAMVGSYDPDKLNQLLDDVRYHRLRCADLERRLAFATAALEHTVDEHFCLRAEVALAKLREPEAAG